MIKHYKEGMLGEFNYDDKEFKIVYGRFIRHSEHLHYIGKANQ